MPPHRLKAGAKAGSEPEQEGAIEVFLGWHGLKVYHLDIFYKYLQDDEHAMGIQDQTCRGIRRTRELPRPTLLQIQYRCNKVLRGVAFCV